MLVKNSAIVFAAVSFSTASAFLFQVLMGRSMTLGDFGQLSAFLSIQTIFSVPSGALILLYSRHAASFSALGKRGELRGLYANGWRVCFVVAVASATAVFAGSYIWGGVKENWELGAAAALSLLVAVYFLQAVPLAFVRGLQKFHLMAVGLGISGVLKLAIAGILVWAGLVTVPLAVTAIIAGVAVSIALLYFLLRPALMEVPPASPGLDGRQMALFTLSAMAGTFFPMFYMNIDMIMVRMLYPLEVSGHYGAFLVAGKMVFLCGQVIGMVLFPAVVAGDAVNASGGNRLMWRAGVLLFSMGGALAAALSFFRDKVMGIILKTADEGMATLLPYYCIAILAVAALFLEWNHRLARQQFGFLRLAAAGAVMQVAGIAYFSASLEGMVKFQAALFCSLLAVRLGILLREGRG